MVAALVEAVAERGYARTTVADVVGRAGVSRATFYQQFRDLEDCMLASFWELFTRLQEEIRSAGEAETEPVAKARAALRRALDVLAADPPSARLLTMEILAAGPPGARSQHEAMDMLAAWLRSTHAGNRRDGASKAPGAEWGLVGLSVMLIGRRVVKGEAERLSELEAELGEVACAALARLG